jgi:hypothetical protein
MMKCISREEGIELLEDAHKGVCGSHSSRRSIIGKAFMHGLYWPTAKDGVMEVVKKCRDCQFFQKQMMKHANPLHPTDISWYFTIWRIDIVGILPTAPGDFRYLLIGIDMFTKWMKSMPAVNITQEALVKFPQSIIYIFGVPRRVLTDNRTHFKGAKLVRCCMDFGI